MRNIYFIGIGGIGMSALARYFLHEGWRVAGYDLTETTLTRALADEGALVHYTDDANLIPAEFRDPAKTLVVFTPAVPSDHSELRWFLANGFLIEKRSEMLGHVAEGKFTMAVAGTHGKTTTTTMVAWLNRCLTGGGSAFLGGISKNFGSNLVLEEKPHTGQRENFASVASECNAASPPLSRQRLAVEADEFDRSFLRLNPDVALITSVDADHLDIYGTHEEVKKAFGQFLDRVKPGGAAILNKKVDVRADRDDIALYTYSLDDETADFYLHGEDIVLPDGVIIPNVRLGIPGRVNMENAVGAVAMVWVAEKIARQQKNICRQKCVDFASATSEETERSTGSGEREGVKDAHFSRQIRDALKSFKGVRRRFDIYVDTPTAVYMDDYAHHPAELAAALGSIRVMFPGRKITAIFQPHLYTRTRDFAVEFGEALSGADELILTPIYPARELPIEGVTSQLIGAHVKKIPWRVVAKEKLAEELSKMPTDVVVTFGAGNIENYCWEIATTIGLKTKDLSPTEDTTGGLI